VKVSNPRFYFTTAVIFAITSLLVLLVDNATTVFALVGSTVTPALDYVVPALLFIKSGAAEKGKEFVMPRAVLFTGVLLVVVSTTVWTLDRLH
jgi:amino acid permease